MTAPTPDEGLVRRLRTLVATELTTRAGEAQRTTGRRLDQDDQAALARRLIDEQLERHAKDCLASGQAVLSEEQEEALARAVFDRIFQLGRLQPLIDDERITNIIANGYDQVFVEYADPPQPWRDLWVLEFAEDGRCSAFEEWPFAPKQDDGH